MANKTNWISSLRMLSSEGWGEGEVRVIFVLFFGQNVMDLTEAEDGKNTQKNCTKRIFMTRIITIL